MSKLTAYMPRTRLLFAFVAVFVLAQMLSVMSAHSQSEPGAPTGVNATAGNAQATITFNAPASVGGGPIMSYWVTASPGGIIGSGDSSPIIMTGLTNGTAYTFVVSATNSFGTGPNSSPSNSVTPAAAPLTLSPSAGALTAGTVGTAYTATVTGSGGTSPYSYAVSAGALPAGLSLNTSTGAITGTPSASGSASFTITATDNNSVSGSASYSLTVNPAVVITLSPTADDLPDATWGNPYSATIQASGGTAPYTYAVTSGGLPEGLSLDTFTGAITGTPFGFSSTMFRVTATDQNSATASAIYSLQVNAQAPLILSPSAGTLAAGIVGSPYSVPLEASGGTPTYRYHVTWGTLPAGLSLDTYTGAITGTPSVAGSASFTITVTDSRSVDSADYTIVVSAPVVVTLSPSAGALTTATAGSAYTTSVTASGGTAPYRYEVSAGTLPAGLSLNTSTGAITGTPSALGSAFFTITATDSNSVSGSAAYSLAVSVAASTPKTLFQNNPVIWLGTPNPAPPLFIAGPTLVGLHNNFAFSGSFFGWMGDVNFESCVLGLGALSVGPYGTTTSNISGRGGCSSSSASTPFNIDGTFDANSVTLSSKGTFSGVSSAFGGNWQRVVFGDFNLQHNSDTGSSTASLNGRVAWQTMTSPNTTLGYFLDGQLAHSNIAGTFEGEQSTYGVAVGGYGLHALGDQLKLNGSFSFGAGQNNLEITDTILALESDYLTRSATIGAALSGVVQQDGFEVRPELSFNYGRTWIGNVDFTGRAFGIVDDTLSLDAGQVSLATMMLRPEVRVPLDGLSGANSLQVVTFAPRLMCEQIKAATTEENCGGGAEVGFSGRSANGLSSVSAKVMADRIGGATKSSLQLSLEHRF